tara:strand:- start:187 stop:468 length:282 start_codon:yes stop_codon:yes gene_type:complete
MNQITKCPPEIFRELEKGCGKKVTLDAEGDKFLHHAWSEGNYLGTNDLTVCSEIECENKKLFLIYDGSSHDGWGLGYSDSVLVLKDLKKYGIS